MQKFSQNSHKDLLLTFTANKKDSYWHNKNQLDKFTPKSSKSTPFCQKSEPCAPQPT